MKLKTILAILIATFTISTSAQTFSPSMKKAVSACENLSVAMAYFPPSPTSLRAANKILKEANIINFGDISLTKGKEININGHFVFDEEFVDSLIKNGRNLIEFSNKYLTRRGLRGSTGDRKRIKMTTKALKAGKTAVWKTVNSGDAEFALVAEPGGLFTMTIKDTKGKVLYAESKKNKEGASTRQAKITLPKGLMTQVLIEITNHGDKDASFALLKN